MFFLMDVLHRQSMDYYLSDWLHFGSSLAQDDVTNVSRGHFIDSLLSFFGLVNLQGDFSILRVRSFSPMVAGKYHVQ
jgi:hypothetical protein